MNDKKPIPIPLSEIPDDEAMAGLRFLRDSGWSLEQILEAYEKLLRQEGAA